MSVLLLDNIWKTFGGVRAVNGVSIDFQAGKATCLLGPNGAGKTTLFNIISGFLTPDRGDVIYLDVEGAEWNLVGLRPWEIARLGIGRLFQDVRVFKGMTVLDNVLTSFQGQLGESSWNTIFAREAMREQERDFKERAEELLLLVGLEDRLEALAGELSYGEQKLLSIARLLATDAEVLLLDEPSSGVDAQMNKVLLDLILRLKGEGKTIIIIEHNMSFVIKVADWVYFMDEGRIPAFGRGPAKEVLDRPGVMAAYIH